MPIRGTRASDGRPTRDKTAGRLVDGNHRRLRIARRGSNQGDRGYPRALPSSTSHAHGRTRRPSARAPATETLARRAPLALSRAGDVLGASAGGGGDRVRTGVHPRAWPHVQASAPRRRSEERRRRPARPDGPPMGPGGPPRLSRRHEKERRRPAGRPGARCRARGRRPSPPPPPGRRDGESYDRRQHTIELPELTPSSGGPPTSSCGCGPAASARRTARPPRAYASPHEPARWPGEQLRRWWTSLRTSACRLLQQGVAQGEGGHRRRSTRGSTNRPYAGEPHRAER